MEREALPNQHFLCHAALRRYFGGRRPAGVSRPFQVSHDLGVTEMFLAVRRLRPELASEWVDEDRSHRRGAAKNYPTQ